MPTHDCSKCKKTETCAIVEIAPWLNEHEVETAIAAQEVKRSLAKSCVSASHAFPIPMYDAAAIAMAIQDAFCLGYYKGRVFQEVPEVFKEA